MASLQSPSPHNNNIIINNPQNHGSHNSTSASLTTTTTEEEPTRLRPRPSSDTNSNPHHDVVARPEEPADRHRNTAATTAIGGYSQSYQDATELVDLPPLRAPPPGQSDEDIVDNNRANRSRSSSISSISSGSVRLVVQRTTSTQRTTSSAGLGSNTNRGILGGLKGFWFRYISMTVPRSQNRDHFALERTYLAYIRTSLAFAFQGVLVAQLFSLQNRQKPETAFGFYAVGRPLACASHACAIVVAAVGAYRFWRQQNALARGKVHAGGWELNLSGVCAIG
ncbi:hypothetical protein AJ78_04880, partial [Emergomyces pasteurianus Ep9510]